MDKNELCAILIADDDFGDCHLIEKAFQENHLKNPIIFVHDGDELIQYLKHEGKYADKKAYPNPCLIFLDLNMPRKDGREALREIKGSQLFRRFPIIVMTGSEAEEDIKSSYDLGVNSYIQKPLTFEGLLDVIKVIKEFWLEVAILPSE